MNKLDRSSTSNLRSLFASATDELSPVPKAGTSDGKAATNQSAKYPRITLRLSEKENAQLRNLAAGITVSAYVRECLFGKKANLRKARQRHKPVVNEQALARVLAMLGETRMANNLNQLAHRANMGELQMTPLTLSQVEEAYANIQAMRAALIKAIGLIEAS